MQEVPGYQQVEEDRQAHQSWVGEREVHLGVHQGLDRWEGKGGHPEGMEALNMQVCINTERLLPNQNLKKKF